MVGAPALGSVNDNGAFGSKVLLDKSVMNSSSGEERWHIQVILIDPSIRDDKNLAAIFNLFNGLVEDFHKFILHGLLSRMYEGKFTDIELRRFFNFSQSFFIENWAIKFNKVGIFRLSLKNVTFCSKMHIERHYDAFSDEVDWWISNLGESLLEVVVENSWFCGQEGQWGIFSHAESGLDSTCSHGPDDFLGIFVRNAESGLPSHDVGQIHNGGLLKVFFSRHSDPVVFEPLPVRHFVCYFRLDVPVG
jgi:hypothetical protein